MKIQEEHVVDFLIGLLFPPFIYFIFNTSILLVTAPQSISDGMALIYVALITGVYYIFSNEKKSAVTYLNTPKFKFAKILGIIVFCIGYSIFN
jgi:hypothetical protein